MYIFFIHASNSKRLFSPTTYLKMQKGPMNTFRNTLAFESSKNQPDIYTYLNAFKILFWVQFLKLSRENWTRVFRKLITRSLKFRFPESYLKLDSQDQQCPKLLSKVAFENSWSLNILWRILNTKLKAGTKISDDISTLTKPFLASIYLCSFAMLFCCSRNIVRNNYIVVISVAQ